MVDPSSFWSTPAGLQHHTPPGCCWPEGESPLPWLTELFRDHDSVIDFGCGAGRLAGAFTDAQYRGVDISRLALTAARTAHPTKSFQSADWPLPQADAALAYTVLLHVSDRAVQGVVQRLVTAAPVVYVVEILGRSWRRRGNPPVFNREFSDYDELFRGAGACARILTTRPCVRYPNTGFTVIRADREEREEHAR